MQPTMTSRRNVKPNHVIRCVNLNSTLQTVLPSIRLLYGRCDDIPQGWKEFTKILVQDLCEESSINVTNIKSSLIPLKHCSCYWDGHRQTKIERNQAHLILSGYTLSLFTTHRFFRTRGKNFVNTKSGWFFFSLYLRIIKNLCGGARKFRACEKPRVYVVDSVRYDCSLSVYVCLWPSHQFEQTLKWRQTNFVERLFVFQK
jgi:hypothetical protein